MFGKRLQCCSLMDVPTTSGVILFHNTTIFRIVGSSRVTAWGTAMSRNKVLEYFEDLCLLELLWL